MRAHDQSYIFSTGWKFRPDYGLLLELHALALVGRSYALFDTSYGSDCSFQQPWESPNGYLKSLMIWAERGGMQGVVLGGHQQE